MLRVLMKLPFLSVTAMEEDDLRGGSDAVAFERPAEVMWRHSHLHVQLGVVDEILQGVSTWVEVLELCVVGDGAHGGVMWPDHPADVDWLDVGEVGEYSCPRCAGGLQSCTAHIWLQPTCPDFYHIIQTRKLLPQAFPSLMGKLNLTTGGATDVSSVPWQLGSSRMWLRISRLPLYPV